MTTQSFVTLFVTINVLLLMTYILVCRLKLGMSYRHWILVAQTLFLASILGPTSFQLLPNTQVAPLTFQAFQPAAEGDESITLVPQTNSWKETLIQKNDGLRVALTTPLNRAQLWLNSDASTFATTLFFWLLVVGWLITITRFALNTLRLQKILRHGIAMKHLGRVKIIVSSEITVPFSAWLGKFNWVVVPSSILLNPRDLRLALKHELQHHRAGDTRWAIGMELASAFFFINPAIYLWKRKLTELQELSCDEALVGQRGVSLHDYGSCLMRVAETALESRQLHAGTTCMTAAFKNPFHIKSFLRRRIEMFSNHKRSHTQKWIGIMAGTVASLITLTLALGAEKVFRTQESKINSGQAKVDPEIQKITDTILKETLKTLRAKNAFAIVADPNTGKILAVSSIDTTGKLPKNWALHQTFEPASSPKTIVAAQAIESGLTTPTESHPCENGTYQSGKRVYHDWKTEGWDRLTTTQTLALSSDICTIKIGEKIGAEGLSNMMVNFGFGPEGSAKSYPQARVGTLPSLGSSLWPEMIPAVSAGYGFKVSALELLQAYGAIANGGNLLMPKSANDSVDPQIVRRVLSAETSEKTKEMLRQVVLNGTAKGKINSQFYSMAGKTTTSYIPDLTQWHLVEGKKKGNFAGFIGFAPVKNPRIEVYVGILDPKEGSKWGAHGGTHAAPLFGRIADEVLQYLRVPADKS